MSRSSSTEAIILKAYPIGEQHRGVILCTPNRGIVSAIAHGAASQKGKLRNAALPLTQGNAYLYEDKVHNSIKITDFDVQRFPQGLREDIQAFFAASIASEIMLYGHVDNDSRQSYDLFNHLLELMELYANQNPPDKNRLVCPLSLLAVFIWKYLDIGGILPDTRICARTGEVLSIDKPVHLSQIDGGFVSSPDYQEIPGNSIILIPPGLRIIQWVEEKPFSRSGPEPLPIQVIFPLYNLGITLIQQFLGRTLKSVRAGVGVLRT